MGKEIGARGTLKEREGPGCLSPSPHWKEKPPLNWVTEGRLMKGLLTKCRQELRETKRGWWVLHPELATAGSCSHAQVRRGPLQRHHTRSNTLIIHSVIRKSITLFEDMINTTKT